MEAIIATLKNSNVIQGEFWAKVGECVQTKDLLPMLEDIEKARTGCLDALAKMEDAEECFVKVMLRAHIKQLERIVEKMRSV